MRRCRLFLVVMLCGGWMVARAAAPATIRLVVSGAPAPLITDAQRAMLGIKFGPDAPIDFFQGKDGRFYINSAGALGPVRGPGRMAAFNLHVDPQLTRVLALNSDAPASGPQDVRVIMTDHAAECGAGRTRLPVRASGGAACLAYFDRDYAGGGAYFRCPDNRTSVYFYHGENHTSPDGVGGNGGWFGQGVGVYNPGETAVLRARQMPAAEGESTAQIIGMNLSTDWSRSGGRPPQQNPYNNVPSVVAGGDGYLYLFSGNATLDPAYNPGACNPGCLSVSRAPVAAFCAGVASGSPVAWRNFYRGAWTQPAVLGADSPAGYGAGGAFTPLLDRAVPGEFGGTMTYLPARHQYAMLRLREGGIDIRMSGDGLHWGEPSQLVSRPDELTPLGDQAMLLYPRVSVVGSGGAENYVLTYVEVTKGRFWRWAQLMRQALTMASG